MDGLAHQIVAGIATGGIYASVALAIVMIYQATHHVNFAQGEMATLSTFIAWSMVQAGMPYWVAFFGTVVVSFGIGVVVERILIRPVSNAPVLTLVGVFIGLLLIVGNATGWIFGYTTKVFPTPFTSDKPLAARVAGAGQSGAMFITRILASNLIAPSQAMRWIPAWSFLTFSYGNHNSSDIAARSSGTPRQRAFAY